MSSLTLETISAVTKLTLARGGLSPDQALGLANRFRQLGALSEARAIVRAAGSQAESPALGALQRVLEEQDVGPPAPNVALPAPFLIRDGFLSSAATTRLVEITRDRHRDFVSSAVHDGDYEGVDTRTRRSEVLIDVAQVRAMFLPELSSAIADIALARLLGSAPIKRNRIELQLTHHGNGAFFAPHSDSGKSINQSRKVSYVYYFDVGPRTFSGGGLRLFDSSPIDGRWSTESWTLINPLNNRLVLFPSHWPHEVELVEQDSPDWEGGRFSINGWLH